MSWVERTQENRGGKSRGGSMTNEPVFIVWRTASDSLTTLTYGDGSIRTYRPDAIDPRAGEVTFAEDYDEFIAAINRGERVAAPVSGFRSVFNRSERFAEVAG